MDEKNKNNIFFVSLIFVLIGTFLRFYQLNFESYWWDEMLGFWVADPNISLENTIYRQSNHDQTSIIFHIIIKKYYQLFGYNPELGRYVPLFFGIISIPFLGILSKQIKNNNSYLLTILLISLNIYLINYSQENRYYSFVFFISIINLISYYKILQLNLSNFKKILFFLIFILISILSLSLSPFILIIFFSQLVYCSYAFYFLKIKNYLFFFSASIILGLYSFINYEYIILELIAKKTHFVDPLNWQFIFNLFFPRFFGSSIMGGIYLSIFTFLLIYLRKKIFFTPNNFLPLILILFFSYAIPLTYGLIATPILFDRYIIFVLIPILTLISILILEVEKKYIRNLLIILIVISTVVNLFFEIKLRDETKPEFQQLFQILDKSEVKNLTLYVDNKKIDNTTLDIMENYIKSSSVFKIKNFKLYDFYNIPETINKVWIACYESFTGYDCGIPSSITSKWILIDNKKLHLLKIKLYEIN